MTGIGAGAGTMPLVGLYTSESSVATADTPRAPGPAGLDPGPPITVCPVVRAEEEEEDDDDDDDDDDDAGVAAGMLIPEMDLSCWEENEECVRMEESPNKASVESEICLNSGVKSSKCMFVLGVRLGPRTTARAW